MRSLLLPRVGKRKRVITSYSQRKNLMVICR